MTKRLVNIGDGRIVEMTEMGEGPPDPTPVIKPRHKAPGSRAGKRKKSKHAATFKNNPKHKQRLGTNSYADKMDIPGYREWLCNRKRVAQEYFVKKKKTRFGVPDGMRRAEADRLRAIAREQVKKDMANLKAAGVLDVNDQRAEEAMTATLEVLRDPGSQQMKLAAAKQVLEWTKAKPATKQDVTINAAEQWLASLADE